MKGLLHLGIDPPEVWSPDALVVEADPERATVELSATHRELCEVFHWEESALELERDTGRARVRYRRAPLGGGDPCVEVTEWFASLDVLVAWAVGAVHGAASASAWTDEPRWWHSPEFKRGSGR